MILLNYAHPITEEQQTQLISLLGEKPEIREIPTHIDRTQPLAQVAAALADAAHLTGDEWQRTPLLLNPPALAPLSVTLIAELHRRCGYFIPILHIRPLAGILPPRFEIGEIVSLQNKD